MQKTAALHNLGCKVNAYETEAMQQLLEEAGFLIVPFSEEADVYVVNTCSVTAVADRKSRQMLHRAKKINPNAIVIACGCYVQTKEEEVKKDPLIDIVIGNDKKNEIVFLIDAYAKKENKEKLISYAEIEDRTHAYERLSLKRTAEHTRAFVKVQDGCDQFCSYCIIPYARGRSRSRELSDVLDEVSRLAALGYQEVVLTGIHLSSFGMRDVYNRQMKQEKMQETLLDLIVNVSLVRGIKRIRLGSLEPQVMNEAFVRALFAIPEICPQFHLSLQSGCDATLRRMNRAYTTEDYRKSVALLRNYFHNPAITTDIIVGFPGETNEEFEETKAFVSSIGFSRIHIFKYSKRAGTKAAMDPNQVPEEMKTARSEQLFAIETTEAKRYAALWKDAPVEVLLETPVTIDGEEYLTGYTKEYIRVAVAKAQHKANTIVYGTIGRELSEELYELQVDRV